MREENCKTETQTKERRADRKAPHIRFRAEFVLHEALGRHPGEGQHIFVHRRVDSTASAFVLLVRACAKLSEIARTLINTAGIQRFQERRRKRQEPSQES